MKKLLMIAAATLLLIGAGCSTSGSASGTLPEGSVNVGAGTGSNY